MAIRSSKHTHLYQPMVETIRLGATKVQPFNPPILRISIRKNPPWAPKHEVLVHAVLPALAYAILELVKCLTHLLLVKKKQTLAFHGTFYPFSTFESPKSLPYQPRFKNHSNRLLEDIPNVQVLATLRLWSKQWKVCLQPRDFFPKGK